MPEPVKKFILNAEQRVYVEHDWGHEDWLWNTRYCGKKLKIKRGKESPWQYHRVRDKVLYVERGKILLTYGWGEDVTNAAGLTMTADMAFHFPPGMYHKMQGLEESSVLELGTHHSEKDTLTADSESDHDASESSHEDSE